MKKKVISTAEARKRFAEITDEVRLGAVYVVVRHGKEVARIVPPTANQEVDPGLDADIQDFFREYGDVLTELAKR